MKTFVALLFVVCVASAVPTTPVTAGVSWQFGGPKNPDYFTVYVIDQPGTIQRYKVAGNLHGTTVNMISGKAYSVCVSATFNGVESGYSLPATVLAAPISKPPTQ